MKPLLALCISFCISAAAIVVGGWHYFGPVGNTPQVVFVVPQQSVGYDVPHELAAARLIKHEQAFRKLYNLLVAGKTTPPGGYRLDGSMTAWGVIRAITAVPDFVWVKVREGLRKEQIGILLQDKLGWTSVQGKQWSSLYKQSDEYYEGVYFPDTYLLPRDETVEQIAKRFIDRFNEKMAPYVDVFTAQNVKWTTAVKIASLIQREAGGPADMPIIAGVIWNRLDQGMRLQIDATLQYVKGNAQIGWWPVVLGADTKLDSVYNTYLHKGLPPTPIANPGLDAIVAVAHPEKTDCLFYLHDHDKQIHCSVTYAEHVENIKKYLTD